MDIVLGVSMTPTTVRMVLVEGERADGLTIDHDAFDVAAADGSANGSPSDQVISAILGTQQSALAGGHRLVATGVTWTDHDEAAALRDGLAAHGIEDVMLVSELHAAGALAQAVGRAVGYDKTALMLIDRDTATLSVVETLDGSIVKVLTRSLHSADAMAVMTEMVTSVEAQGTRPQGLFVVGSGVDVTSVEEHLEHLVSIPVSAPEDSEMALTRGAAIAAASAPRFEASTVGLAYSQDPEALIMGDSGPVDPWAQTQLRLVAASAPALADDDAPVHDETRRPFLLVGSTLTGVFIIGVVALVITLAASIRPTVDTRPNTANPGENVVVPTAPAAPASPPQAQAAAPPAPIEAPAPPPETIKAPIPVVKAVPQAPPRQVVVEQAPPPAPAAPPPVPEAPAPVPAAPIPAPVPVIAPPVFYPPVVGPILPRAPIFRPPWYRQQPQQPPWTPPQQQDPRWDPPQQQDTRWDPPQQQPQWTPPQQQQQPQWTPPQQQQPQWTPPQQQQPQWTPPQQQQQQPQWTQQQQQQPQWTPPQQQQPQWTPPQQQEQPQWTPPQQQQPQWTPPQQQMPQRPSGPLGGGPRVCIGRGACF